MMGRLLPFAMLIASIPFAQAADAGGDPIAGKAIFQRICQNCHSNEIGTNKVGPSLWNVVGRQAGTVPGFEYSDAMRGNKSAWTTSSLDTYLADPRGEIHGAKMFFRGLPASRDRSDVIAYLETLK